VSGLSRGTRRLFLASCVAASALAVVGLRGWAARAVHAPAANAPGDDPPADVDFRRDVEYGRFGDETLRLDLSLPKGATGRLPAIVVIHGGAWRAGSLRQLDELTWHLAEQGFVAATVGYRFCPQHHFPAQVQDVKCAVRYLRAHADELHIDAAHMGAIGFSAGAHLALMLGVMDAKDGLDDSGGSPGVSSKVQAVVSYFGPTDLELPATDETRPLLVDFLGGTLEEARDAYHRASPVNYVDGGDAPMLLFQGTNDPLVPPVHATRMADAMQAAGVAGRVELLVGAGHGDWTPEEFARTSAAMLAFFREHLGLPAAAATDARPVFEGPPR
jgi:acetyl esterase/lipase